MKCVVNIELENAAFDDAQELPRILRELAGQIARIGELEPGTWPLRDINGNRVGEAKVTGKRG